MYKGWSGDLLLWQTKVLFVTILSFASAETALVQKLIIPFLIDASFRSTMFAIPGNYQNERIKLNVLVAKSRSKPLIAYG